MNVWFFVAPLALTMAFACALRLRYADRMTPWAYRGSVLGGAGVVSPFILVGGYGIGGASVALGGAFAGGVLATTVTIGFVENNAPVTTGVREKIMAHHTTAGLAYPTPPRLKRSIDLVVSAIGIALTLPLWILIGCCVWIEQPGPIFFKKNSVGRGGIVFHQLKFRSMRYDAERLTGPIASPPSDPRTLRSGAFLRRWHLDEMPELINVLTGTMSLVGPRPLRAVLVQRYLEDIPGFVQRHVVRPGIACIAQIEKYHISPRERLRKDSVYIRRMSIGLDVLLLWRAVATTVRGARTDTEAKTADRCS